MTQTTASLLGIFPTTLRQAYRVKARFDRANYEDCEPVPYDPFGEDRPPCIPIGMTEEEITWAKTLIHSIPGTHEWVRGTENTIRITLESALWIYEHCDFRGEGPYQEFNSPEGVTEDLYDEAEDRLRDEGMLDVYGNLIQKDAD